MEKINKAVAALLVILALYGCEIVSEAREEYVFYTNGIRIEVGDDTDEVITRLGAPNRHRSAESCAGLGCDEEYVYNGFKISAYREGDECEIISIELTNDTVSTAEGISIGALESEVLKKYGEGKRFPWGIEYTAEECTLRFYLSKGRVSGIKYLENGE